MATDELTSTSSRLCDLRHVTSSAQMASHLMTNMSEAFNGGNVLPTGKAHTKSYRQEVEVL